MINRTLLECDYGGQLTKPTVSCPNRRSTPNENQYGKETDTHCDMPNSDLTRQKITAVAFLQMLAKVTFVLVFMNGRVLVDTYDVNIVIDINWLKEGHGAYAWHRQVNWGISLSRVIRSTRPKQEIKWNSFEFLWLIHSLSIGIHTPPLDQREVSYRFASGLANDILLSKQMKVPHSGYRVVTGKIKTF